MRAGIASPKGGRNVAASGVQMEIREGQDKEAPHTPISKDSKTPISKHSKTPISKTPISKDSKTPVKQDAPTPVEQRNNARKKKIVAAKTPERKQSQNEAEEWMDAAKVPPLDTSSEEDDNEQDGDYETTSTPGKKTPTKAKLEERKQTPGKKTPGKKIPTKKSKQKEPEEEEWVDAAKISPIDTSSEEEDEEDYSKESEVTDTPGKKTPTKTKLEGKKQTPSKSPGKKTPTKKLKQKVIEEEEWMDAAKVPPLDTSSEEDDSEQDGDYEVTGTPGKKTPTKTKLEGNKQTPSKTPEKKTPEKKTPGKKSKQKEPEEEEWVDAAKMPQVDTSSEEEEEEDLAEEINHGEPVIAIKAKAAEKKTPEKTPTKQQISKKSVDRNATPIKNTPAKKVSAKQENAEIKILNPGPTPVKERSAGKNTPSKQNQNANAKTPTKQFTEGSTKGSIIKASTKPEKYSAQDKSDIIATGTSTTKNTMDENLDSPDIPELVATSIQDERAAEVTNTNSKVDEEMDTNSEEKKEVSDEQAIELMHEKKAKFKPSSKQRDNNVKRKRKDLYGDHETNAKKPRQLIIHSVSLQEFHTTYGIKRIAFNYNSTLCAIARMSSDIEIWDTSSSTWPPIGV